MKKLLLATVAAVISAGPVMAGSVSAPLVEPMIVEPLTATYDWTGAYIGGQGGALFGTMDYVPGPNWNIGTDLTYGAYAGYNFQSGNMVYGGEIAASLYEGVPNGFVGESFDYIVDAKARVGVAMDNVLLYGFGGVSTAHYTIAGPANWQLYGVNFGAGGELGLSENLSVGAEYIGRYLTGSTNIAGQNQNNWLHGIQGRVTLRF